MDKKIRKPRKHIYVASDIALNQESQRKIAHFAKYVNKQCDKPKEKSVVTNNLTPKPCCRPGEESSGESLREKAESIFLLVHSLYNSQTFKKKQRELVGSKVFIKFSMFIFYHSG